MSGITGLVTADIGAELGNAIGPTMSGLTSKIASPVLRQAATNAVTTGGIGFALGTAGGLASGKSLGASLGEGARGGAQGLALGAITGGAEGFRIAKETGINPWTGRPETIEQAHILGLQSIAMDDDVQDIQYNKRQINADMSNNDYTNALAKWNGLRAQYRVPQDQKTWFEVPLADGSTVHATFYPRGATTPNGYSIKIYFNHPVIKGPRPIYIRYK